MSYYPLRMSEWPSMHTLISRGPPPAFSPTSRGHMFDCNIRILFYSMSTSNRQTSYYRYDASVTRIVQKKHVRSAQPWFHHHGNENYLCVLILCVLVTRLSKIFEVKFFNCCSWLKIASVIEKICVPFFNFDRQPMKI